MIFLKCDKCGKDANIEIFLKADGIEEKLNLCFNCYSNMLSENLSNTGEFNPNYMKDLAKVFLMLFWMKKKIFKTRLAKIVD